MRYVFCLITFLISPTLFADDNAIARAICEDQVVPDDTYKTDCQLVEYHERFYEFYKDTSLVALPTSAFGLAALSWFIYKTNNYEDISEVLLKLGWGAGFVAVIAGMWGAAEFLDSYFSDNLEAEVSYSLESETPNLRDAKIDVIYQAVKTVNHKSEDLWERKPGKTGIAWGAGIQFAGSILSGLIGLVNTQLKGGASKWLVPFMTLMVGSSAGTVIDWYANPPIE